MEKFPKLGMEFASEGESPHCRTCDMDLSLHYGADAASYDGWWAVWPKCPPVILVPPLVRMAYPANVIQVDFVRKERVA